MDMIGSAPDARRKLDLFLKAANVLESVSQYHSVKISRSSYLYYLNSFFLSSRDASASLATPSCIWLSQV